MITEPELKTLGSRQHFVQAIRMPRRDSSLFVSKQKKRGRCVPAFTRNLVVASLCRQFNMMWTHCNLMFTVTSRRGSSSPSYLQTSRYWMYKFAQQSGTEPLIYLCTHTCIHTYTHTCIHTKETGAAALSYRRTWSVRKSFYLAYDFITKEPTHSLWSHLGMRRLAIFICTQCCRKIMAATSVRMIADWKHLWQDAQLNTRTRISRE
jgi:hypothetical protein